jgi:hypothetical protein
MNTFRNHFWNLLLTVFFAGMVSYGIWYLVMTGGFARNVALGDFFLMALAVWRLTRLFTYDAIMKFVRDWFVGAKPSSLRGTLHTLINCPWCTGLWFAFFVVFFYFATPYAWPVILILAVAAVGSFFQILSNFVGWSAELRKAHALAAQNEAQTHIEGGKC